MGCCAPDLTLTKVTCGQGTSCVGQCSAIGASLCLSEICTADPDDCNISLEPEKRKKRNAGTCKACQSSQKLRKCAPSCRVKRKPACCFHPVCYEKRPKYCSNTNYFSGIPFYLDYFNKINSQETLAPNLATFPMERGVAKPRSCPCPMQLSWMEVPTLIQVRKIQLSKITYFPPTSSSVPARLQPRLHG